MGADDPAVTEAANHADGRESSALAALVGNVHARFGRSIEGLARSSP
jgi:hypothetical protein